MPAIPPDEHVAPAEAHRPSHAFSWATLGFILGALFVILQTQNRRRQPAPSPAVEVSAPEAPTKPLPLLRLTTVEDVFASWSQYAVWSMGTSEGGGGDTEIAMFDTDTKQFSDCYQVIRAAAGVYFFRSIPKLDRPVLTHGNIPDNAPLQFTETQEQHDEWLREVQDENDKAFRRAMDDNRRKNGKAP